jgi:hypothetical protein
MPATGKKRTFYLCSAARDVISETGNTQNVNFVRLIFFTPTNSVYLVIRLQCSETMRDKWWDFLEVLILRTVVFRSKYSEEPRRNRPDDVTTSQIHSGINTFVTNKQCQFSQWFFFLNSDEQWINKCKVKDKWKANKIIYMSSVHSGYFYKTDARTDLLGKISFKFGTINSDL